MNLVMIKIHNLEAFCLHTLPVSAFYLNFHQGIQKQSIYHLQYTSDSQNEKMGQYLNVQKNVHLSGTWCLVSFQKNMNTFNIFHIRYKKFYKKMDQIRNSC